MNDENPTEMLSGDTPIADVIRIRPLPSVESFTIKYHFDVEGRFMIDTYKRVLLNYLQISSSEEALANNKQQRMFANDICDNVLRPIFHWTAKSDAKYYVYGMRKLSVFSSQLRFLIATAFAETCDDESIVRSLNHLLRDIHSHLICDFSRGLIATPSTTDTVREKKSYWKSALSALVEQGMTKPYFDAVSQIFDCYIENYVVTIWNEEKYLGIQESL